MDLKPTKTYTLQVPITEALRDEIDAEGRKRVWSRAQSARYLIERGIESVAADRAEEKAGAAA